MGLEAASAVQTPGREQREGKEGGRKEGGEEGGSRAESAW